jgi:hypothetical protein
MRMSEDYQVGSLDMLATSKALAVTEGVACDPPYLYVTPHNDYLLAKIDTRSFAVVDTLDLAKVDPSLSGMLGSFVVGGYLYILPHLSNSGPIYQNNVVRVDLNNFTPAGCQMLEVLQASAKVSGSNGLTDGANGYLNLTAGGQVAVTCFGLGENFTGDNVSMVSIATIEGYPVLQGFLVAVDQTNVYMIATVITYAGTGNNDRTTDLWLVTVPTADFTAEAANFQRLTNLSFLGGSSPAIYSAVDDGKTLWTFPMPILAGPMTGKFLGVMQIPKANPAAVTIHQGPPSQPYPSRSAVSGTPFYDGWRYGYVPSQTAAQILRLDTQNPGTVESIDISGSSASYPMYGLGYDGEYGYAVSFNGGAGLCLRFMPTPRPGG